MLINILAEGRTQSWVTWSGSSCFERGVWTRQSPKVLSHKNCSVFLWYCEVDDNLSRKAWWKPPLRPSCGMTVACWPCGKYYRMFWLGRNSQETLIPPPEMDSIGIEPTILAPLALCSSQLSYSQGYPSIFSLSLPDADTWGISVFTSVKYYRLTKSLSSQQGGHSFLFMPQQSQRPDGWRGNQVMLRMRVLPQS